MVYRTPIKLMLMIFSFGSSGSSASTICHTVISKKGFVLHCSLILTYHR